MSLIESYLPECVAAYPEEEMDPEELENRLYEQYLQDQEARKALIKSRKK